MPGKQVMTGASDKLPKNPSFWGLSEKLLKRMDKKVNTLVEDWQECFKIRSWNNSFYAQVYIEGLLTLDRNWNFKNISRHIIDIKDDGQGLHRDILVYLEKPVITTPHSKRGRRGRKPSYLRVDERFKSVKVRDLLSHPDCRFETYQVRSCERGVLNYEISFLRVWTVCNGKTYPHKLIIRKDSARKFSYSLSNAPVDMPAKELAWWRCQRYFVERIFQDFKSELGWSNLEACKYRAWEHHTALTALAMWFITQVKLDRELFEEYEIKILPALSVSNIREMLKACLCRGDLTAEEAAYVVAVA